MSSVKLTADSGGGTVELKAPASTTSNAAKTLTISPDGLLGITNYDEWHLTSALSLNTNSDTDLTANLSRQTAISALGSAMTESSGVFTFPSTGIWRVRCIGHFYRSGGNRAYVGWYIKYTANNGTSWSSAAAAGDNMTDKGGYNVYVSPICEATFDITDTSQQKVKFVGFASEASVTLDASDSYGLVPLSFTRIGDT